jgi:hypothetical protein
VNVGIGFNSSKIGFNCCCEHHHHRLPQKLLPVKVSGYCFIRFRTKDVIQGEVVSPTPKPRLSRSDYDFCQGCVP